MIVHATTVTAPFADPPMLALPGPLVADWAEAARGLPELARALVVALGGHHRDASLTSLFADYGSTRAEVAPIDWSMLADAIERESECADRLRRIVAARLSLAIDAERQQGEVPSISTGEALFWTILAGAPSSGVPDGHWTETLDGERSSSLLIDGLIALADLAEPAHGDAATSHRLAALVATFDKCLVQAGDIPWHALMAEARRLWIDLPVTRWSPQLRSLLSSQARQVAAVRESLLSEAGFDAAIATDLDVFADAMLHWWRLLAGRSAACFVRLADGWAARGVDEERSRDDSVLEYPGKRDALSPRTMHADVLQRRSFGSKDDRLQLVLTAEVSPPEAIAARAFGKMLAVLDAVAGRLAPSRTNTEHDAPARDIISRRAPLASDIRWRQFVGEFSAGAGHEINNPLGAIVGQSQRLLDDESDPERRHSLERILDQVARIKRMIRDLQLIGRRGMPATRNTTLAAIVDVGVRRALARLGERAEGTSVILPSIDENVTVKIAGDDGERLVEELTCNAIEAAGANGWVRIEADGSDGETVLKVIDSGPGFSPDDRRHAFTPFYCGKEAGRLLGMGLAVARRLCDDNGMTLILGVTRPTTVLVLFP